MGTHDVTGALKGEQQRNFMRQVLRDLRALERILAEGKIEAANRRIGGEQELFLVDRNRRPATKALEMLRKLGDDQFTTELGLFNLELNLRPRPWGGDCLRKMEEELTAKLAVARKAAREMETELVLTGILPTLLKSDLDLKSMTPLPRYRELNRALRRLRGESYDFHIKGMDELNVKHDSVMLESCNASFQVHFQVGAEEFANLYNISQVVSAPVLAAAVNSPLLFGLRLWKETRIALFQQAVDTRGTSHHMRESRPRVFFGDRWVERSVLELYQEDITRFRTLVGMSFDDDPFVKLDRGETPDLPALRLHNGTVYRWNRACYGVIDGKPHLRIENRVLPSGPTVIDEIANAAFWFGLISGFARRDEDIKRRIDFDDVKMNFLAAARLGLQTQFSWLDGEIYTVQALICDHLLPLAEEGLRRGGIDEEDVTRYLKVIDERVRNAQTGAAWALHSLARMGERRNVNERMHALTAAMITRQESGTPVSAWTPADVAEAGTWKHTLLRVEQFMSTDLFTVNEDEPIDLVANLMKWERIRHVLVEDHRDRLVGLVSYRALLRQIASGWPRGDHPTSVSEIMKPDPVCVAPETSALRAIEIMREFKIACLPVVQKGRLVGVVTEREFMDVAADLLAQKLRE